MLNNIFNEIFQNGMMYFEAQQCEEALQEAGHPENCEEVHTLFTNLNYEI